jgi:hypothetical protein
VVLRKSIRPFPFPPSFVGSRDRTSQMPWVWGKQLCPLLGRSSEAFTGVRNPAKYVLGHAFIHSFGASEHLLCTAVPVHRIVVGHA